MNPVVGELILKDLNMNKLTVVLTTAVGVLALATVPLGGVYGLVGIISFFIAMILLGSMIPAGNIVNERKRQNLAFLMSLPVSSFQYTLAKLIATIGVFILPWLALVTAATSMILIRADLPDGLVPMALVLAGAVLTGFCVNTAVAMVSESEGWTVGFMVAANVGYNFLWVFIIRQEDVRVSLGSPYVAWSPTLAGVGVAEVLIIAAAIGITLYVQAKKRDFV